ncbi:MAG: alpha-amylase/4-alpha-glucanotransferase domain-containing protein [Desulfurococcaceae archaeon]
MPRINFVFAIHFHQPHGQLKWINERIYENSYKLLLDVFKQFSDLKFTIHISGPLLQYMKDYYPDWLYEIAKLKDYGTLELIGGSYSEAILPILHYDDRLLQIKEYFKLFEKIFGFKPRGFWLPERVWEPSITEILGKAGIDYVLIDDSTMLRAGYSDQSGYYAFLMEESGYRVKVLFIDTGLRYVLPWRSSSEVIDYMISRGDESGSKVIVWGSDAEKFGEWQDPGWARQWLNDFLSKLRRTSSVSMVHPSEYFEKYGVRGLMYLPNGSYDKMLEWSRGFFRNFLVKYAESNNMHKKMLWVRNKLVKIPYYHDEAWRTYLNAQCNDAYWHGLFGGIYLSHLRQAIYENLIIAERIAEEVIGYYDRYVKNTRFDIDYDGYDEVILESPNVNIYVSLADGGTIFEFDYKRKGYEHNIQDTMTRYMEPYLVNTGFNPDWYRRVSGRIHLWDLSTNIRDWIHNTPFKDRSDLALSKHKAVQKGNSVVLKTIGGIYSGDILKTKVLVEKEIAITDNGYRMKFRIENIGEVEEHVLLGLEFNIAPKLNRVDPNAKISYEAEGLHDINELFEGFVNRVAIKHTDYPDIVIEINKRTMVWVAPIYSLARTEKGLKQLFQHLGVMFVENTILKPREPLDFEINQYVSI